MSDVVVTVVESNTNVTVTEQDVAVAVTETTVEVSAATAGIQGNPGANNDPVYVTVRNATGALITKGSIVYVSGGNGTHTQVTKAIASGDSTSARTLGWLADDIANNADGLCMVEGYLDGVNTQGVTEGVQLYLSGTVAGAYQVAKPVAPIHLVYVGVCVKASAGNGRVYVKVQNGYELSELHDVLIVSPTNNQVLAYDSATQLWKNATNAPDGVTSITATAPLTGGTITSTGSIGLDQTALSITKSQVSDFTSGTVTSASTAQQAGTAVFADTSGTATYATTSGTAVTISGTITTSQVSDFASGTVASAGTAQQAGTAVFATNASTAVTISGSIAQSQVTNLVTDLAGKANLAGGNAFTGAQTVTGTVTSSDVLRITGASGQSGAFFQVNSNAGANLFRVNSSGFGMSPLGFISGGSTQAGTTATSIYATSASNIGAVIRGAASQSANLLELQDSAANILTRVSSAGALIINNTGAASALLSITGTGGGVMSVSQTGAISTNAGLTVNGGTSALGGFHSASATPVLVVGATNQVADLQIWRTLAGTTLGGRNANAQIFTGSTAPIQTAVGAGINGVTGNGTTVTFSTTNAHGLANGDRVTIAGLTPAGYNGTYIISGVSTFSFNIANTTTGTATGSGTVSVDAQASITSRSAGTISLQVRGATSQAADLLRFVNAGGTTLSWFNAGGSLFMGGSGTLISAVSGRAAFITNDATQVPMLIRGAASQSANLLELQNSAATILTRVSASGSILTSARITAGSTATAPAQITSFITDPAIVGLQIQGAASQSANLQEWQNSAGIVLAKVGSGGVFNAVTVSTTNGYSSLQEASSGGNIFLSRMTAAATNPGANNARLYLRDGTNAGTLKLVVRAGAAGAETTILDNIPQ